MSTLGWATGVLAQLPAIINVCRLVALPARRRGTGRVNDQDSSLGILFDAELVAEVGYEHFFQFSHFTVVEAERDIRQLDTGNAAVHERLAKLQVEHIKLGSRLCH